jgi:HAD superfamily hydrolase (TIGR01509 family)
VTLRALLFDVDGTLADTEELHRQAFNAAFAQAGLAWYWSEELYAQLLAVTGGKERLRAFIDTLPLPAKERAAALARVPALHAAKTAHFTSAIDSGAVALRPGVERLVGEARAAGLPLAIASTTTAANVEAILRWGFGKDATATFDVIATGDIVRHKKPAPDIYLHALAALGVPAAACVAIEDAAAGVAAAHAAGITTVAVPTRWTRDQDLRAADLRLDSLGDPQAPLAPGDSARIGGAPFLSLAQLRALQERRHAGRLRGPTEDAHASGT